MLRITTVALFPQGVNMASNRDDFPQIHFPRSLVLVTQSHFDQLIGVIGGGETLRL